MCSYNCVGYLLVFSWLLPCVIECLVCQFSYIYMYTPKTRRKERTERQMHERTNERNILNITKRPLVYSICDYEEQTSLCDLSSFLLRMYLMGCPPSFLPCSTRVTRKRETEKKRQNAVQCDASIQYKGKKEKNDFFCFSIEKKPGQRKRVVGE